MKIANIDKRHELVNEIGYSLDVGRLGKPGEYFYRKPYSGTCAAPKITDQQREHEKRQQFESDLAEAMEDGHEKERYAIGQ